TRNYHAYLFVDDSDGALFGAAGASLTDVLLGSNPEKPAFHYIYGLGDYWFHDIYVEKILPASESNGKVALLAGGGACP
ncbi:hypothetical protein K438DRAFT_1536132, partial [Mycena galopus ATCC 62051]